MDSQYRADAMWGILFQNTMDLFQEPVQYFQCILCIRCQF